MPMQISRASPLRRLLAASPHLSAAVRMTLGSSDEAEIMLVNNWEVLTIQAREENRTLNL